MVYISEKRCFKVIILPEDSKTMENPNKFIYIFLYYDETFKILKTSHKSYRVCFLLYDTILRAYSLYIYSTIVSSLVILEKSRS